ncbi:Rad2 nuclease, partial [Dissophora globulifera]
MGVKRAWQLLTKKGLVPDPFDKISTDPTAKIRVDVCATHNTPIRHVYSNPIDLNAAHSILEHWLLKISDKDKLRFYIDGLPAQEKKKTHSDRHERRQKALVKANTAVSKLECRLAEKKRIKKYYIADANKNLQKAFQWSLDDRKSFVAYMTEKNYDIVLCPTEADVLIAAECRPQDAVVTCDSDLLFYRTVPTVWRPVGSYKARCFVPYEKPAVLKALSLSSTQLTALAILSGNDYCCNIPYLAIDTNHKIVKNLHGDEKSVIRQYLSHPQVKRRTDKGDAKWSVESYASAIKVFVELKQTVASESASTSLVANGDNAANNNLPFSDNGTTVGSSEASLTDNST